MMRQESVQIQSDNTLNLGHRVMYYVIHPLAKRLPVSWFAALAMAVAVPAGLLRGLLSAAFYGRILRHCGRRNTIVGRIRLAVHSLYAKARHLDRYIYDGTPKFRITWDGDPEAEPCIFVLCHSYGNENVGAWIDHHPAIIVRLAFAGEGDLDLATATADQMWRAHQASIRQKHAARHRHVIVGKSLMASRPLLTGRDSMILYQDLHVAGEHDGPMFLGVPVTLQMGALRIARSAGGMPIRYMTIRPRAGQWHIHVGGRLEPTYEAIAAAIESDIRSRPEQWMLWNEFFAHADSVGDRRA